MSNRTFYNEVLTDHNIHPENKFKIKDFTFEKEGVNPSCGDDIVLQIKYEDGVITDAAFVGEGCAISQASTEALLRERQRKKLSDFLISSLE